MERSGSSSDRKMPSKQLGCEICGRQFASSRSLKFHKESFHDEFKTYDCDICGEKFPSAFKFNKHRDSVHSGVTFDCNVCGVKFVSAGNLERHRRYSFHSETEYKIESGSVLSTLQNDKEVHLGEACFCCICGKVFENPQNLQNHLSTHPTKTSFSCDICGKELHLAHRLKMHRLTHTKVVQKYERNSCGKNIIRKQFQQNHEKLPQKKFDCHTCGKQFGRKSSLGEHKRKVHNEVKSFQCDICEEKFPSAGLLNKHRDSVHSEVTFDCNVCGSKFVSAGNLERHKIISFHTETECSCQSKVPPTPSTLENYREVHLGKQKCPCDICGKVFENPQGHLDTHRAKTWLPCDICGKVFRAAYRLNNHRLTHNGVKIFRCEKCGKEFSDFCSLKIHTACNTCGNNFSQTCRFQNNEKMHNGVNLYECEDCNRTFPTEELLHNHKIRKDANGCEEIIIGI